jgi:hypothetical protein
MATSLWSTWRTTLNTCAAHGIPNNLLNPCSNEFKIALTIQRQEVFLLGILRFKAHFSAAHRQHKQMQGEYATTSGYHSANAAVGRTEDEMAEATIGSLANLTTATAADRGVVAALAEANARLAKQLEDNSNELRELKALIKKKRTERRGQRSFNPYKVANTHTSLS